MIYDNFIPRISGRAKYRPGLKYVPYRQRSILKRFIAWWRGEPVMVNSMVVYGEPGVLYVATDRGMFYLDKDGQVLKPMYFTVPTEEGDHEQR